MGNEKLSREDDRNSWDEDLYGPYVPPAKDDPRFEPPAEDNE